jgi:hypothetical protein
MTKPTRALLLYDGKPLLLTQIKRDKTGDILSGYVVNGNWDLHIKDDWMFACHVNDTIPVTRFKPQKRQELPWPDDLKSNDYNHIIYAIMEKSA